MPIPNNTKLYTIEGIKKMEEELDYLRTVKSGEVAERIKVARSFGDISENAEFDEAKNEQAFVAGRIMELESILRDAQVVSEDDLPADTVSVGSIVKLRDEDSKREVTYSVVGASEADPLKGRISSESPVGKALFGKRIGETVKIVVPAGIRNFSILAVSR